MPLILSGILQLLFSAADTVVVGRFTGKTALAAVGSTGSLINLIINLFIGLSVGASVVVAQNIGARREKEVSDTVHTSVAISLLCGVLVSGIGISLARVLLEMMGSPDDVIDQAVLYFRIYFLGAPASLLFNFCGAILRASGDTKRPLYALTAAGIINVILNLIFVIIFHMGVAGVAIATIISQAISAAVVVMCLIRRTDCCHLDIKSIRIHSRRLFDIIRIGVPAGLQSAIFSLSNVLIQSSINSFGSAAMAGAAAASNLDGFIYTSMNAVSQSAMTFTGQNVGARKYERINRIFGISCSIAVANGIVIGGLIVFFGRTLLGIYSKDPAVIDAGMVRLSILGTTYFLCGIMDTICGEMRGMGQSVLPMVVSTIGACGLRIVWIYTVFASYHTLQILFCSYPVTWIVTSTAHLICYFIVKRRLIGRDTKYLKAHAVKSSRKDA